MSYPRRNVQRDKEIVALFIDGKLSCADIGKRHGTSRAVVEQVIQRARARGEDVPKRTGHEAGREPIPCACGCGALALPGRKYLDGHKPLTGRAAGGNRKVILCACGCGEPAPHKRKYVEGHWEKPKAVYPPCACGCGETTGSYQRKYAPGHRPQPEAETIKPLRKAPVRKEPAAVARAIKEGRWSDADQQVTAKCALCPWEAEGYPVDVLVAQAEHWRTHAAQAA